MKVNPNRPNLSFSEQYGHIVNLTEGKDEKTYIVELEPSTIKELKQYGLAITGQGYYLRSVNVVGKSASNINTSVDKIAINQRPKGAVYTINGFKVRDANDNSKLSPGIYIIDGKKVLIK